MTADQKINQLEGKLKSLEEQLAYINKHLGLTPDKRMLQSAVEQIILNRDVKQLENYIKLGGKLVTQAESEQGDARSVSGTIPGAKRRGILKEARP